MKIKKYLVTAFSQKTGWVLGQHTTEARTLSLAAKLVRKSHYHGKRGISFLVKCS